jgi:zinc D-Ala-D-Ala carboxypeptidase
MKISTNITFEEATHSQAATRLRFSNMPDADTLSRMKLVASEVFEKVRGHFGVPIRISSFYRCPEVNKAIGGSATSQHMRGEAIDIQGTGNLTNKQIYDYIKAKCDFDQLIWEYGNDINPAWVHVSYKKSGNRKQILRVK